MANPDSVFTVGILRDFVAQHFLIGGDWGRENQPHSHHYRFEAIFEGPRLDGHGYLLDIAEVEPRLDGIVERYRDRMLNDLPEFAGLNPSIEHFSRILCAALNEKIQAANITKVKVVLWENEIAWVSYKIKRNPDSNVS
jgi:6-pyruvoyltetrahydropterin/6-carboxytetrahydropterin synthase